MNLGNLKRIMFEKKSTSPSLRNKDWRTVKAEAKKKKKKRIINTYVNEKHHGIK